MNSPTPYQPIDCNLYDYIEIACMHGYDIRLWLQDNQSLMGTASTTHIDADGEFLVVDGESTKHRIRLDLIVRLQVLSSPRAFDQISFRT